MGYNTTYTLKILNKKESNYNAIYDLIEEYEEARYAINEKGETEDYCKWYDHGKDLRQFSTKYPETVFKLSGDGEDSGDVWSKYFKNGKVQYEKAKIIIGDYQEDKLV